MSGVPALDPLLSEDGWAYASLPPQEPGDPGRFHALFGRDSLISALQVLPAAPEVARGDAARARGAARGSVDDPENDEEPGKILHEYRPEAGAWFVETGWPVRDGGLLYYGTADATSWFLIVLAALDDAALTAELAPAWRAAARLAGRRAGRRRRARPLRAARRHGRAAQQGWRDAIAPVRAPPRGRRDRARRTAASRRAPLADADCQAAAVAALDALERLEPGGGWAARAAGAAGRARRAGGAEVMAIEARRHASSRARARSSAGCCGPARWRARRPTRRPSGSSRRTCSPTSACARCPPRTRAFRPRGLSPRRRVAVRLLARLGRPARGRPARGGRAGPHAACSPRSTGSGWRRSSTPSAPTASWSRCPSRTGSRRGPSARAGRSSRAGTGVASGLARAAISSTTSTSPSTRASASATPLAGALEQQVDARVRDPEPADLDAAQPAGQRRAPHAQPPRERVGHEPEPAGDEVRDRAGRPGLRLARDGVRDRRLELGAPVAGEELRQPVGLGVATPRRAAPRRSGRSRRRSRTRAARTRSAPCRAARPCRGGSRPGCSPSRPGPACGSPSRRTSRPTSARRARPARAPATARAPHSRWPWLEASASLGRPSAPKPIE